MKKQQIKLIACSLLLVFLCQLPMENIRATPISNSEPIHTSFISLKNSFLNRAVTERFNWFNIFSTDYYFTAHLDVQSNPINGGLWQNLVKVYLTDDRDGQVVTVPIEVDVEVYIRMGGDPYSSSTLTIQQGQQDCTVYHPADVLPITGAYISNVTPSTYGDYHVHW